MKNIISLSVNNYITTCVLYNELGKIIFKNSLNYAPEKLYGSIVEQDPEVWIDAAVKTIKSVTTYAKNNNIEIEAITITSQNCSILPVDKNGAPLNNTIMMNDKRADKELENLLDISEKMYFYKKTGLIPTPYLTLPRIIWLKEYKKDVFKNTYKMLGVQDYITHFLTGEFKTDHSQASKTMLMNIYNLQWDKELMQLAGIDENKLCELVPPGTIAGKINKKAAKSVGLKVGTPVITCGAEQQNAAIALNTISAGKAEVNIDDDSFIACHTDKPIIDNKGLVTCSASAVAGKWLLETNIYDTGETYKWCKDQFYKDLKNGNEFEIINTEAATSPVGANGVVMISQFEDRSVGWEKVVKNSLLNMSLSTSRSDIARAIIESITMDIANKINLLQELAGKINQVNISGKLAKSDFYAAIQANVCGIRIVRYTNTESSTLGAAMLGMVSLGIHKNVENAFSSIMERTPATFEPDECEIELYRELINKRNKVLKNLENNI